jgi:hypothetical protein
MPLHDYEPRESLLHIMERTEAKRQDALCKDIESRMRGILDFPPNESLTAYLATPSEFLPDCSVSACIETALNDLAFGPEGRIHWIKNLEKKSDFLETWTMKEPNISDEDACRVIVIVINFESSRRHQFRAGRDMDIDTLAQLMKTFEGAGAMLLAELSKNSSRVAKRADNVFG